MKIFQPPNDSRDTDALIEIAHCTDRNIWQKEATEQAKIELSRREISTEYQEEVLSKTKRDVERLDRWKRRTYEMNKKSSYAYWEMAILLLLGPILFLRPHLFNSHTMYDLYEEKFYLKLKQRVLIFAASFFGWFLYIQFFGL